MEFLLECIGFPPDHPLEGLVELARAAGEPVALRGPGGEHLQLPLGHGLQVRLDREEGSPSWTMLPYLDSPHRLRVAVTSLETPPDSPFDCLLRGWADPPPGATDRSSPTGAYMLAALLWDARRLPRRIAVGHVLAVSLSAFALDVEYVGPNAGARDPTVLERPRGAWIQPLGGARDPGGCVEASLRIREVKKLVNPLTNTPVDLLETDAPGRPLQILVSQWQLEQDGIRAPRPGWRIEGTFLLSGRLVGGLPSAAGRLGRNFG